MTGLMHGGFVLKLEYARPPAAAVKLVAQWTDWGHIWGQLICKSNKAPEIESYVAHPQVSRPDDMPAPLLFAAGSDNDEIKVLRCWFTAAGLLLALAATPLGHLFLMSTLRGLPSGQTRTWAAPPMKTRMSVERMTRSHEIFRLYGSTLILCTQHPVAESFLTHTHNPSYTAKPQLPENVINSDLRPQNQLSSSCWPDKLS